jgi:hypothetical protein
LFTFINPDFKPEEGKGLAQRRQQDHMKNSGSDISLEKLVDVKVKTIKVNHKGILTVRYFFI